MHRLFSYGSLQQPAVQLSTFGRLLVGREDVLPGFELRMVQHGERQFANVIRSGNTHDAVPGTVFEISDAELARADEYEQADTYTRIAARGVHVPHLADQVREMTNPPEPKRFRGKRAPPPCGERRAALPSDVEEVHGGGTSKRDACVRHGKGLRDQVFQLSALSSSDERLCQLDG